MNQRQEQYATDARALQSAILGHEYRHRAMRDRGDPQPWDITAQQYECLQQAVNALEEYIKLFP